MVTISHFNKYVQYFCTIVIHTGYSWDQPQRSQHTEGSKGFNIKTSWFPSVSVHRWMATFSVSLLLFGQKLQDNTEESVTRERGVSRKAVRWFWIIILQYDVGRATVENMVLINILTTWDFSKYRQRLEKKCTCCQMLQKEPPPS